MTTASLLYANITGLPNLPSSFTSGFATWTSVDSNRFVITYPQGTTAIVLLYQYNNDGTFTQLDSSSVQYVSQIYNSYGCYLGNNRLIVIANGLSADTQMFDLSNNTLATKEFKLVPLYSNVIWASGHPTSGRLITYESSPTVGSSMSSLVSYAIP
jgi:hypothetical protein